MLKNDVVFWKRVGCCIEDAQLAKWRVQVALARRAGARESSRQEGAVAEPA